MSDNKQNIKIDVSETIKVRDNLKMRWKQQGCKKFISEIISGWFPNAITKDIEWGVEKTRVVDKGKNEYHETVKDLKTGKIIHDCHEKLTNHRNYVEK